MEAGLTVETPKTKSHILDKPQNNSASSNKDVSINNSDDTVPPGERVVRTAIKTIPSQLYDDDDDGYSEYLSSTSEEEDDPDNVEHLNKDVPNRYTSDALSDADFKKLLKSLQLGNVQIGQSSLLGNTNYNRSVSPNKEAPKSHSPAR